MQRERERCEAATLNSSFTRGKNVQFGFVTVPEPHFKEKDKKMSQTRPWWVSGVKAITHKQLLANKTHDRHSLHDYWIISIYDENKFPFGTPAQIYWHLVDPLIFKFLHLQRSTSESFLRLRTERSCTWEFPSWPENPKREAFHA